MKSLLLIPAAVAVVAVSACGNSTPKVHYITRTVYSCNRTTPHTTVTHHVVVVPQPQPTRTVTHHVIVKPKPTTHKSTKISTTKSKVSTTKRSK